MYHPRSIRAVFFFLLIMPVIALPVFSRHAEAQQGGFSPPEPAPSNKPMLPPAPPPQEVDDMGYCIVGGSASLYCNFSGQLGDCVPLPTSLRVPKLPAEFSDVGWASTPNAAGCGTEPCFFVLRCECGAKLLDDTCGMD